MFKTSMGSRFCMALAPAAVFAMSASLDPSKPSPAPLGTVVTWTATVADATPGTIWYRFRAHAIGQPLRLIKDYGPGNKLDWSAGEHESLYEIVVDARNTGNGETAQARGYFDMQSLVSGGRPAITPTSHPLVFLYSAPACPEGARMRVQFQRTGAAAQNTPYKDCEAGLSMNFYLGGLRAKTQYSVRHTIDTGSEFLNGPALTLTTSELSSVFVDRTVVQAPPGPLQEGILLQATTASTPLATDLGGNVIWYYPGDLDFEKLGPFLITRPERGGYFFGIVENLTGDRTQQIVREFDLTGRTVLETNAARVNEQLAALGKRSIGAFHHEARRLPDGKIVVIASVEQILKDVQGEEPVDIIGEMIIVLDRDLQVVWTWDAFDHLDPRRVATQEDSCPFGGCPPLFLAASAKDWLHANSVAQTPDGNLLFSSRSQDWVIKIDYSNGDGNGGVLWRLGKDGDFQLDSTDPSPWFSHQHDPQLLPDNRTVLLFDNSNVRFASDPTANSRGQLIRLDEQNRVATLVLNADLGQFSAALGSAQKLPNGNYHFDLGVVSNGSSVAVEVDSFGKTVYALKVAAPEYRSFRMRDIYTP